MYETIITSKLFMPPMATKSIIRDGLLALLSDSLAPEKRLVLVCAPAGYGKTTLVCNWLRNMPNVCWYSLEEGDNDLVQFFSYLIACLHNAYPEIGQQAQGLLQAPQPPAPRVILSALLKDLTQINTQIVIVLDDYQMIHTRSIHDELTFLLDHLPSNVHVVITSRSDPALPLHRYRSRGQMVEIRADLLRFSMDEISEYMHNVAGIPLGKSEIVTLEQRTEGWAAGLQMAALSMRGKANVTQFIQTLAGTNRYILDYLVEEAINNQPETVQRFLMETSILNRFNAALCADLLGIDESASRQILTSLEQANLFLVPLDDDRIWYRYHHLFQDLLSLRLRQSGVDVRPLHQRTATWYEANGLVAESIQHLISAEAFEHAADLVERHTFGLFALGELHQLVSWIRKLPADLAARRPWLCLYQAWALAFAGKNRDAELLIETVEQALGANISDSEARQKLWDEVHALHGLLAITSGNLQKALEVIELPDPMNITTRSSRRWVLGYARRMQGRLAEAAIAFSEMLTLGQQMNNIWTISTAAVDLGMVLRLSGRLGEAETVYRTGLDAMQQAGARGLGFAGRLESFLANTLYEQNRLDEAQQMVADGINHNALWDNPNHVAHGHWVQARILFGMHDLVAAKKALHQAETIAEHPAIVPPLKASIAGLRVRIWLSTERLSDASNWLGAHSLAETTRLNTELLETYTIIHARILMAQKNPTSAHKLLEALETDARAANRINTLIETLTLKALCAPNRSAALTALEAALTLGIPAGYRRTFLDEGPALKPLLESLRERSNLVEPLMGVTLEEPSPLTTRETDILRAMAEGLSNKEIGVRLYISAGTVKAHSAAIYRKLESVNRTEAMAKAKDLGLL